MASRGTSETEQLKERIEGQLKRLLTQLSDLEEMKEDLDEEEYESSRQDTLDQMKEFEVSLENMSAGNMSLVDSIGSVQLSIQQAIRNVTSGEIASFFANKQNGALRSRLGNLDSDLRLKKISHKAYVAQAGEIVQLLEKLGESLSDAEKELLKQYSKNMDGFTAASGDIGAGGGATVMAAASQQIGGASK